MPETPSEPSSPSSYRRLRRMLSVRNVTVSLDGAVAARADAFHARLRQTLTEQDPEFADLSFEDAMAHALESAITADERARGLVGTVTGELLTQAEYDQAKARSRQRGRPER